MNKKQVRYGRHFLSDSFSFSCHYMPFHRGEHLEFKASQHLIGGMLGIGPFKVTHHKPLLCFVLSSHWFDFLFKAYLSILPDYVLFCLSSSCILFSKKFGLSSHSCLCFISINSAFWQFGNSFCHFPFISIFLLIREVVRHQISDNQQNLSGLPNLAFVFRITFVLGQHL